MYWDISFIYKKSDKASKNFIEFLNRKYQLNIGDNETSYFGTKKVIVFLVELFDDNKSDYDELCISFSNQEFTKVNFNVELEPITNFVNQCFKSNPYLEYALCSYELNGYLIGQVKKIQNFNNYEFLKQFPIVYKRRKFLELPYLQINIDAQKIFV